jgi:uncharacterized protein YqeY
MLIEKIKSDLNEAMKAKNETKVSTLRFLLSAINNKAIELQKELTDEDINQVIAKQVKERKESIVAFSAAGREELAAKERDEMGFLSIYLPQQLTEVEVEKIVNEVIGELGANGPTDFGRVMSMVMARVKGQTDGNIVSGLVKKVLG